MERWRDGEMGKWGNGKWKDGDMENGALRRSGWQNGEMGKWEIEKWGNREMGDKFFKPGASKQLKLLIHEP
jgi:hypothetical protein